MCLHQVYQSSGLSISDPSTICRAAATRRSSVLSRGNFPSMTGLRLLNDTRKPNRRLIQFNIIQPSFSLIEMCVRLVFCPKENLGSTDILKLPFATCDIQALCPSNRVIFGVSQWRHTVCVLRMLHGFRVCVFCLSFYVFHVVPRLNRYYSP